MHFRCTIDILFIKYQQVIFFHTENTAMFLKEPLVICWREFLPFFLTWCSSVQNLSSPPQPINAQCPSLTSPLLSMHQSLNPPGAHKIKCSCRLMVNVLRCLCFEELWKSTQREEDRNKAEKRTSMPVQHCLRINWQKHVNHVDMFF